jgi:hypothetical protein
MNANWLLVIALVSAVLAILTAGKSQKIAAVFLAIAVTIALAAFCAMGSPEMI